MGVIAFGSVILYAQSQGAGRHQWDVNVLNGVKVARVRTPNLKKQSCVVPGLTQYVSI